MVGVCGGGDLNRGFRGPPLCPPMLPPRCGYGRQCPPTVPPHAPPPVPPHVLPQVRLWKAVSLEGGPRASWDGVCRARFNHAGNQFVAVSAGSNTPRRALIYDVAAQTPIMTLQVRQG